MLLPILSLLFLQFSAMEAGSLLFVFPVASKSHHIMGEELAKPLLKRGHQVTMIAPFRSNIKSEGYREIVVDNLVEWKEQATKEIINFNSSMLVGIRKMLHFDGMSRLTLEHPSVKDLLKSNASFDAVVIDPMLAEALFGFSYFYKAPTIVLNTQGTMFTVNKMVGNSNPFAYVPSSFMSATDEMTFFQRTLNLLLTSFMSVLHELFMLPLQERVLRDRFPDAPPLTDLFYNVSLILLNAHFSVMETPRPYMPNMIPIAGYHIQPQKLPKDLKQYLDEAKEGVVFFSLGSNFKTTDLPKDRVDAILRTFERFPLKFLWKFEDESLEVPKNVKISKWLPQRGVLEHPNVKAFITHGGLLSVTEAIYYGVPFVGIPAFADQEYNIVNSVKKGIGVAYSMNDLTEDGFAAVIREVLENPSYKKNIAQQSDLFRSQPVQPLDLAVFWIEHVMKYRGAPYLQSAAVKLNWIQSYLLDVIGFIVAVLGIITYLNFLLLRKLYRYVVQRCFSKKKVKLS